MTVSSPCLSQTPWVTTWGDPQLPQLCQSCSPQTILHSDALSQLLGLQSVLMPNSSEEFWCVHIPVLYKATRHLKSRGWNYSPLLPLPSLPAILGSDVQLLGAMSLFSIHLRLDGLSLSVIAHQKQIKTQLIPGSGGHATSWFQWVQTQPS